MTNEQMLTAIIERAEKNGWDARNHYGDNYDLLIKYICQIENNQYKLLLIDHDFCKALWGTGKKEKYIIDRRKTCYVYDGIQNLIPRWKIKLQEAIISDNMLQYVYDSIKE